MARWILAVTVLGLTGCFNGLVVSPVHVGGPVSETIIADAHGLLCRDKVALIDIDGLLINARLSGLLGSGENPVSLFREKLEAAAYDPKVKAVVLRINSPGGAVTATDIMLQDLLHFRRDTQKPVVACLMDVAASGGYYIALGSDRIYAHPTTVTGSIGVIMNLYNASGLLSRIGVISDPIKSGPNKDLGNPARPMTDEERAILQEMVSTFYDQFVSVVVRNRHLTEDRVRTLADGRVYTGIEAKRLGLVDEIGYLEDAIQTALDLACLKDARIIAYDRCDGYRGSIYASVPKIPREINVKLDVPGLSNHAGAAFLYLWQPGEAR